MTTETAPHQKSRLALDFIKVSLKGRSLESMPADEIIKLTENAFLLADTYQFSQQKTLNSD